MLSYHLAGSSHFVQGVARAGNVQPLLEGILGATSQVPEHLNLDTVTVLEAALMLRLTSYREVGEELGEEWEPEVPEDLPAMRDPTTADILVLSSLKQASDYLNTSRVNKLHKNIVQLALSVVANVSAFAEGLTSEASLRLLALFERCGKAAQLKKGQSGASFAFPLLVESIYNILQYQYSSNVNLAYGLMTRLAHFRELLATVAAERAKSETGLQPAVPNGEGETPVSWWRSLEALLTPIGRMLEVTVPKLEAEVDQRDVSSSEEAKTLVPRCILGLMPVPQAFALRTLRYTESVNLAAEHCLAGCLSAGPAEVLWEVEAPAEAEVERGRDRTARDEKRPRPASRVRARSSGGAPPSPAGARDRSSSRARGQSRPRNQAPARPEVSPTANADADPASALKAQLEAAAAQGVDVTALLREMQSGQAPAKSEPGLEAEPAAE